MLRIPTSLRTQPLALCASYTHLVPWVFPCMHTVTLFVYGLEDDLPDSTLLRSCDPHTLCTNPRGQACLWGDLWCPSSITALHTHLMPVTHISETACRMFFFFCMVSWCSVTPQTQVTLATPTSQVTDRGAWWSCRTDLSSYPNNIYCRHDA